MTRTVAGRVGFYGKLPSRGDFVRAVLSRETVAAWDGWLQEALHVAAARIGEDAIAAAWARTPAWRLALPPGQCGPCAIAGLWLTSHDQAGRRFALLAAAEGAGLDEAVLDRIEASCRVAIGGKVEPEHLASHLEQIVLPPAGPIEAAGRWWSRNSVHPTVGMSCPAMPSAEDFLQMISAT